MSTGNYATKEDNLSLRKKPSKPKLKKNREKEFDMRLLEISTRTGNPNREEMSEADNVRIKQSPQNIIP